MTRIGLSIAVLAVANVLNNRWLTKAYVPNSVATTLVLLTIARRRGLSWHELGLGGRDVRRGLTWAAGSMTCVASTYAVAFAIPATRAAFVDQRARNSIGGAAYQALVPVLFGTVLLEEVGFRGVLWGLLNRDHGAERATALSSFLFGLWHILPSRGAAGHNQAVARAFGSGSWSAVVPSSVAFTAAAGVVFCELRRRSGSLAASAGLHWATNGLGYVLAAAARRSA